MAKTQKGLYMENAIWDVLEGIARREKRSINQVIELIIEKHITENGHKSPLLK